MIHLFCFHNITFSSAFVVLVEVKCLTNSSSASENFSTALKVLVSDSSAAPPTHNWPVSCPPFLKRLNKPDKTCQFLRIWADWSNYFDTAAVHVPKRSQSSDRRASRGRGRSVTLPRCHGCPQAEAELRRVVETA